jgi:hypothetical protein
MANKNLFIWNTEGTRKVKAALVKEYTICGYGNDYHVLAWVTANDDIRTFKGTKEQCTKWINDITAE